MMICGAVLLLASCDKIASVDSSLMYGKWMSNDSEYYRFDRSTWQYMLHDSTYVSVNGARWKPGDDVTEEEAQPFVWSINGSDLTLTHQMYTGGKVPKTYTITSQSSSKMTWKDSYGNTISLTKK
mgnify:FL=1